MSPFQITRKYRARIRAVLKEISEACVAAGWDCSEVFDLGSDDGETWCIIVSTKKRDKPDPDPDLDIDVKCEICWSESCDGERGGVNFRVDVVTYGGCTLGGLCPFNYSDRCWVPRRDRDEVEERFRIIEDADPTDLVEVIHDYLGKRVRYSKNHDPSTKKAEAQ